MITILNINFSPEKNNWKFSCFFITEGKRWFFVGKYRKTQYRESWNFWRCFVQGQIMRTLFKTAKSVNHRKIPRYLEMLFVVFCIAGAVSHARILPDNIRAELQLAGIPEDAAGIVVQPLDDRDPVVAVNPDIAFHPASIMKVVTTYAALELLGPQFRWITGAYIKGKFEAGVLDGDLIIKGSGDPSLSYQDLWLFVREIQDAGIHEIRGNVILDRHIFGQMGYDPAAFDGAPLKPYNAGADGLLLNDKRIDVQFIPDNDRDEVMVTLEPRLDGITVIPPVATSAACANWQTGMIVHFDDGVAYFEGEYPLACGRKKLAIHPYQMSDSHYFGRIFEKLWREAGGTFNGKIYEGMLPNDAHLIVQWKSPTLGVVVNAVNKYSNNVKARQLLLTLGAEFYGEGITTEEGVKVVRKWLAEKGIVADDMVIENGSGLSREEKITSSTMARILKVAYESPVMPELISSFPVVGRDGTMSRRLTDNGIAGKAHIKTGAINDVRAIAGYVLAKSGRRYLVVCMINHPNAKSARLVLDGLLDWTYENG